MVLQKVAGKYIEPSQTHTNAPKRLKYSLNRYQEDTFDDLWCPQTILFFKIRCRGLNIPPAPSEVLFLTDKQKLRTPSSQFWKKKFWGHYGSSRVHGDRKNTNWSFLGELMQQGWPKFEFNGEYEFEVGFGLFLCQVSQILKNDENPFVRFYDEKT